MTLFLCFHTNYITVSLAMLRWPKQTGTSQLTSLAVWRRNVEKEQKEGIYHQTSQFLSWLDCYNFLLSSFKIDPSSGVITVKSALDREVQAAFSLTVIAKDSGTPSLSASVVVRVIIDDVNDNAPVFSQQMFYGSISEDASSGSTVLKVGSCCYSSV